MMSVNAKCNAASAAMYYYKPGPLERSLVL